MSNLTAIERSILEELTKLAQHRERGNTYAQGALDLYITHAAMGIPIHHSTLQYMAIAVWYCDMYMRWLFDTKTGQDLRDQTRVALRAMMFHDIDIKPILTLGDQFSQLSHGPAVSDFDKARMRLDAVMLMIGTDLTMTAAEKA